MQGMTRTPSADDLDKPLPIWTILIIPLLLPIFVGVFIFPVAGDWLWLEGWLLVGLMTLEMTVAAWIMNARNPRALRNRMASKKEGLSAVTQPSASSDRFLMPLLALTFLSAFVLPGLGRRFGWPSLPLAIEVPSLLLGTLGLALVSTATLQNAFAAKLLDIRQGQRLIDTGLYGVVRHPLYAGFSLWILSVPLALGSLWGLIPAVLTVIVIMVRIGFEEQMLIAGMAGYEDYQKRVKYRLLPGIY